MRTFDQAALDRLMADYDRQFPTASEFHRGSFEFEAKKVLGRLEALGATIAFPEAPRLTTPQKDALVGWATWPLRTGDRVEAVHFVKKPVAEALVRRHLAEGPYRDYPDGWKVELTEKGMDLARDLARAEGQEVVR